MERASFYIITFAIVAGGIYKFGDFKDDRLDFILEEGLR